MVEFQKNLKYAKTIIATSKNILLLTGSSVVIFDRCFNFLKKISNLKYVYQGYVSPDEKYILLVSNLNRVHILSLENLTLVESYTVRKPYAGNLEGRACWCSKNSFLLPIQNDTTMLSMLRKVTLFPDITSKDVFPERFLIIYIKYIESKNCSLILGLDRASHNWNIICFDDKDEYTIHPILNFNEAVLGVEVLSDSNLILLTGESKIHCCDFNGIPSKLSGNYPIDIVEMFGEFPMFCKTSKHNSEIAYLGLHNALIFWNSKYKKAINSYHFEFGARDIEEIDDILLVSTCNGIKMLS